MEVNNNRNIARLNTNELSTKQKKSFAEAMKVSRESQNQSDQINIKKELLSVTDKVSLSGGTANKGKEYATYARIAKASPNIPVVKPTNDLSETPKVESEVALDITDANKINAKEVDVEDFRKKIRDLAINQLRSKVGQTDENGLEGDADGNKTISFNDISELIKQMDEGNYDNAINLAFEGVRSRVGQSVSENEGSKVFDLSGDGVVSFADLSELRGIVSKT